MLELLAALELIQTLSKRFDEVRVAMVEQGVDQNALLAARRGGHRGLL